MPAAGLFGPAVPPSQLDRLHAALGCPRGRAVDLNSCLVRQSGELKQGATSRFSAASTRYVPVDIGCPAGQARLPGR